MLILNQGLLSFPLSAHAGAQEGRTQHSQDRLLKCVLIIKSNFLLQEVLKWAQGRKEMLLPISDWFEACNSIDTF